MKVWDDNNTLTKRELASLYEEVGNAVESTGQTLDSSGSTITDSDTEQLARAMSYAGGGASMMTATGGATDTITLTPWQSDLLLPEDYNRLGGFTVRFFIATSRTVNYTITLPNISTFAVPLYKDLLKTPISPGDIPTYTMIEATYLTGFDNGGGVNSGGTCWTLTPESAALLKYDGGESVTLPNGLIMKSGFATNYTRNGVPGTYDGGDIQDGGYITTVTFGTPFPTGIKTVNFSIEDNRNCVCYQAVRNVTTSSASFVVQEGGGYVQEITGIYWQAIGY
jgi:hypothetical protein